MMALISASTSLPPVIAGRAIDTETATDVDGQPSWINLPAMMKMRISTPHYLDQMKGKASPFGFVLHPRTREELKLTLLTPFTKDRAAWTSSECVNTHDGQSHRLNTLPRSAVITWVTFFVDICYIPKLNHSDLTPKSASPIRVGCYSE